MNTKDKFLYSGYSNSERVRFLVARDDEHLKERASAVERGYHVR